MRFIPTYLDTNIDGQKLASAVYLLFFYRVKTAGRLRVEFEGLNQAGFEPFNAFSYDGDLEVCDGYKTFDCSGLWNGTGDFKLSFTGEINLYMLILSTDRAEALAYRYKTFFEQSEKLIKIAAANFDKYGNVLESSHIITTAKYNELISQRFNADGTLKNMAGLVTTTDFNAYKNAITEAGYVDANGVLSQIQAKINDGTIMRVEAFSGMFATAVNKDTNIVKSADIAVFVTTNGVGELISNAAIRADQITLEGIITANQNFKVLADGSIETKNAKINGYIYSPFIDIRESDAILQGNSDWWNTVYLLNTQLSLDATFCTVILPVSEAYAGARVLIMDSHFIITRTATPPTRIKTADGSKIVSGLFCAMGEKKPWAADYITIDAGVVELILKKMAKWDYDNQTIIGYEYNWILISNSCRSLFLDQDY